MGCLQSKSKEHKNTSENNSNETRPQYSWEKREKVNPKDFTFEKLENETLVKLPGSINGQQFILRNLKGCVVYLFDHIASITVDDCENCKFFIGAVKTSIFIRDCTEIKMMIACQQFRTRDCKKMQILLCCTSQPIIESTTSIKFGCMQAYYPKFSEHIKAANLSIYNNNWSSIHDFTPVPGEDNFSLIDATKTDLSQLIPLPSTDVIADVSFSTNTSTIPVSAGTKSKVPGDNCLVVFFKSYMQQEKCSEFVKNIATKTSCILIRSREIQLELNHCTSVFGSDEKYSNLVQDGSVIGLEYCGNNIIENCKMVVNDIGLTENDNFVYISHNIDVANRQIDQFFHFADIHMNAS